MTDATPAPVIKQDGVTDSERYLHRLGTRAFLSLWSYPGVYRRKGEAGNNNKEVCDLLVVFDEHVIVFSDKACAYPEVADARVAWGRWFKKSVMESAKQLWGAERAIRTQPEALFLDRACLNPFPVSLPPPDRVKIHRVAVAHGTRGRGTLALRPGVAGRAHYEGACEPFVVGDIDPSRGLVHVLDDVSLDVVLGHLDTVRDFVAYLEKKERFFRSGKLVYAANEEDLLAYYLAEVNSQGEHDFVYPPDTPGVVVEQGEWHAFRASDEYSRQQAANRVSRYWDALIEEFARHIHGGTSLAYAHQFTLQEQERAVRLLANEGRTRRRLLAQGILELRGAPAPGRGRTRIARPTSPAFPHYLFLAWSRPEGMAEEYYRQARRGLLDAYCHVVKFLFPDALDVVGIATETAESTVHSQDVFCMDTRAWSPEQQAEAENLHTQGFLKNMLPARYEIAQEYPG